MSRKTHVAFAILLVIWLYPRDPQALFSLGLVAIAAMLPDLDLILSPLPGISHRKTFHNIWFLLASAYVLHEITPAYTFYTTMAVLSHFILDSLTKTGVAWLWPLSKQRLKGPLKTGGLADKLMLTAFTAASAYLAAKAVAPTLP